MPTYKVEWIPLQDVKTGTLRRVASMFAEAFHTNPGDERAIMDECDTLGLLYNLDSPRQILAAAGMVKQHVRTFAVQPLYQKCGFGKYMMHCILARYGGRGPITLTIESGKDSTVPLQKFYEKFGFRFSHRLKTGNDLWMCSLIKQ